MQKMQMLYLFFSTINVTAFFLPQLQYVSSMNGFKNQYGYSFSIICVFHSLITR